MKQLIFINGPMGVGKSTVALHLSRMLHGCPRLCGDSCWKWHENPTDEEKEELFDTIADKLSDLLEQSDEYVIFEWVMHEQYIIDEITSRLWFDFDLRVFTLICTPEKLTERIKASGGDEAKVQRSLERLSHYSKMSHYTIDTTNLSAVQVAEKIKEKL